jgi:transposase-like protein
MALQGRKFPREFKLPVVREVAAGKPVAQAAREDERPPTQIAKWRHLQRQYAESRRLRATGASSGMRRARQHWKAW